MFWLLQLLPAPQLCWQWTVWPTPRWPWSGGPQTRLGRQGWTATWWNTASKEVSDNARGTWLTGKVGETFSIFSLQVSGALAVRQRLIRQKTSRSRVLFRLHLVCIPDATHCLWFLVSYTWFEIQIKSHMICSSVPSANNHPLLDTKWVSGQWRVHWWMKV